jgi:hypothetical protein
MSALIGGIGGALIGSAVISGGLGLAGAAVSSNAAGKAADEQSQAALQAAQLQYQASQNATAVQQNEFNQQQQNIAPWLQAGKGALSQMSSMAAQPVSFTQQDFQNNMDPAYQFDLQQGQQALERSAAARGSLMSGGTLKDLTNYAQGSASNEYQNAYNRFMNNQNTQYNRLASLAGTGQTAAGQIGQAGMNMATNVGNIATGTAGAIGNLMTGSANAQAASQIASGNAWGSALSGIGSGLGNAAVGYQTLSALNNTAQAAPAAIGGGGGATLGYNYGSSPSTFFGLEG